VNKLLKNVLLVTKGKNKGQSRIYLASSQQSYFKVIFSVGTIDLMKNIKFHGKQKNSAARFRGKNMNSTAWLEILRAAKNCVPYRSPFTSSVERLNGKFKIKDLIRLKPLLQVSTKCTHNQQQNRKPFFF